MDQITYNRMRRRGGFMRLPVGTDGNGVDWFYQSHFTPRLDRDEVANYLRGLFASLKEDRFVREKKE